MELISLDKIWPRHRQLDAYPRRWLNVRNDPKVKSTLENDVNVTRAVWWFTFTRTPEIKIFSSKTHGMVVITFDLLAEDNTDELLAGLSKLKNIRRLC